MCKFTTKARLHFFSSYNQIIPPDEMKTERKKIPLKKGRKRDRENKYLTEERTFQQTPKWRELGKDVGWNYNVWILQPNGTSQSSSSP